QGGASPPRLARHGGDAAGAGQGARRPRDRPRGGGAVSARYVVGIDLGTTHTALSFAEIPAPGARAEIAPIPQLVAQGTVEARPLLPSFLYLAHESEGPQALPWDAERRFVVGEHARARGVDAPARLVSSAKSWLSHAGVDRRGPTL